MYVRLISLFSYIVFNVSVCLMFTLVTNCDICVINLQPDIFTYFRLFQVVSYPYFNLITINSTMLFCKIRDI